MVVLLTVFVFKSKQLTKEVTNENDNLQNFRNSNSVNDIYSFRGYVE